SKEVSLNLSRGRVSGQARLNCYQRGSKRRSPQKREASVQSERLVSSSGKEYFRTLDFAEAIREEYH
ncbi:MAG: hypothetical protein WA510_32315, partial [Acidobacteriaceae bacterium]